MRPAHCVFRLTAVARGYSLRPLLQRAPRLADSNAPASSPTPMPRGDRIIDALSPPSGQNPDGTPRVDAFTRTAIEDVDPAAAESAHRRVAIMDLAKYFLLFWLIFSILNLVTDSAPPRNVWPQETVYYDDLK